MHSWHVLTFQLQLDMAFLKFHESNHSHNWSTTESGLHQG